MKFILSLSLLVYPLFAVAERCENNRDSLGTIIGIIFTIDGQPAAYVTVAIKNISRETITDATGKFEINKLRPGFYTLSISFSGYKTNELNFEIKSHEIKYLKIPLQLTFVELTNINIKSIHAFNYLETKPSSSLRLIQPLIEIPQNIVLINRHLLADQGLLSMTEAIRNVSGIQKTSGGLNDYSLLIRGTDATYNVFRNGIGGYWWNQQEDIAMLERIEFVKGPAGFMISMAEPGGVINNVTKQPTKEKIASIDAVVGSYNLFRMTADFGGKLNKSASFSYRFNAGLQHQQRAFQFANASRYFVCGALKYEPNEKIAITAEYNSMYAKTLGNNNRIPSVNGKLFTFPRNFTIADENTDRKNTTDESYRIQVNYSFSENWQMNAQVGYLHGSLGGNMLTTNEIPITNDTIYRSASFDDWRNYSAVAQVFVNGKIYTGKKFEHKVLMGLDYANTGEKEVYGDTWDEKKYGLYFPNPQYYTTQDSLRNFTIGPEDQSYKKWIAMYLQDHLKIGGKFVFTIAGHLTNSSVSSSGNVDTTKNKTRDYNVFTPRAGLTWLFSDNISIYSLYDQCFLPQTGKIYLSKEIKPLTGYNIEFGLKSYFFSKKLGLNLSFYNIVKDHTLTQDPQHPDCEIESGQVTSRGIDFDLIGNITQAFSLNTNYSFIDAKITKDTDPNNIGIQNFGTPKHSGNLWLKYKLINGKLKDISLAIGYQYMGKRSAIWFYNPDPYTRFLPEYNLLDAAISYSREKYCISFNVYNLTNINYVTLGYFNSNTNEWRYTPGEPLNFRIGFGVNLCPPKKIR